jgi:hypothetical protein
MFPRWEYSLFQSWFRRTLAFQKPLAFLSKIINCFTNIFDSKQLKYSANVYIFVLRCENGNSTRNEPLFLVSVDKLPTCSSLLLTPSASHSFSPSLLLTPPHSSSLLLNPPHSSSLLLTPPHSSSLLLTPPHSSSNERVERPLYCYFDVMKILKFNSTQTVKFMTCVIYLYVVILQFVTLHLWKCFAIAYDVVMY